MPFLRRFFHGLKMKSNEEGVKEGGRIDDEG